MAERGSERERVSVLIVDDHQLMREGLRTLLEMEEDILVVGEAPDGRAAVEAYLLLRPRVVLMDIRMPVMDGVEAIEQIRARDPDARVLVLTTFDEDELVRRALRAGASGYLLKDATGKQLSAAVHSISEGGAVLEPSVARKVVDAFAQMPPSPAQSDEEALAELSGRERAVLGLLAQGLSNKEIAVKLYLVEGTVKNYVSVILQKLHVRDRTQAVLKARNEGLLE